MERYKFLKNQKGTENKRLQRDRADHRNKQHEKRNLLLEQNRAGLNVTPIKKEIKKTRLDLLKEWKDEKKRKEKELVKPPPPFYVGKVQRTAAGSPIIRLKSICTARREGAVTRSQASRRNAPMSKPQFAQPMLTGIKKIVEKNLQSVRDHKFRFQLTVPDSPKITKSSKKGKPKASKKLLTHKSPIQRNSPMQQKAKKFVEVTGASRPATVLSPPTENIAKNQDCGSDLGVAKIVYSPSTPEPITDFSHIVYSPNITVNRGSQIRPRSSLFRNKDANDKGISEELVNKGRIQGFRLFLTNETKRLLELADQWKDYINKNANMSEEAVGDANATVGKTMLLTSDKFKQFLDLINKCVDGDPKIKVDDLQGFHDWVTLEVEDLDKAYKKLAEGSENNWLVKTTTQPEHQKKKIKVKKPISKPVGARSALAAIIQAKRKLMAENVPASPPRTPRDTSSLRIKVLNRNSGLHILAATASARLSLSPAKSPTSLPSVDVSATLQDNKENLTTPSRSVVKKSQGRSQRKNGGLDPRFFMPADTSPDSPEILDLLATPRRSNRLAKKAMNT